MTQVSNNSLLKVKVAVTGIGIVTRYYKKDDRNLSADDLCDTILQSIAVRKVLESCQAGRRDYPVKVEIKHRNN